MRHKTPLLCGPYLLRVLFVDRAGMRHPGYRAELDVVNGEIRINKYASRRERLHLLLRELLICSGYAQNGLLAETQPDSEELHAHAFGPGVLDLLSRNPTLRQELSRLAPAAPAALAPEGWVWVAGHKVSLKSSELGGLWGAFQAGEEPCIWLEPSLEGAHQRVIFLHEVYHAFHEFLSLGKRSCRESTSLQAAGLLRLLEENPGLYGWLTEGMPSV